MYKQGGKIPFKHFYAILPLSWPRRHLLGEVPARFHINSAHKRIHSPRLLAPAAVSNDCELWPAMMMAMITIIAMITTITTITMMRKRSQTQLPYLHAFFIVLQSGCEFPGYFTADRQHKPKRIKSKRVNKSFIFASNAELDSTGLKFKKSYGIGIF